MNSIYCFTSDIDWVPDFMIRDVIGIFKRSNVPLTIFVTHKSKAVEKEYFGGRARYVGLHPNFRSGSSHGKDYMEVIGNVVKLWNGARYFRSHSYYDSLPITLEFVRRGFKYDSNLPLYSQKSIVPLEHASGLIRFPTFFDDYLCAMKDKKWNIDFWREKLQTKGMKILNFHPIHVCMNTPTIKRYESFRDKWNTSNWKKFVYDGEGTRTFLMNLIDFVKESGDSVLYLDDLYEILFEKSVKYGDNFISEIKCLLGR